MRGETSLVGCVMNADVQIPSAKWTRASNFEWLRQSELGQGAKWGTSSGVGSWDQEPLKAATPLIIQRTGEGGKCRTRGPEALLRWCTAEKLVDDDKSIELDKTNHTVPKSRTTANHMHAYPDKCPHSSGRWATEDPPA